MNTLKYDIYEFDADSDMDNDIKLLAKDVGLYNDKEFKKFKDLLNRVICNFTVVSEYPYIEKNFRDSYYNYHARKFVEHSRNCTRLLLFRDFNEEKFFSDFTEERNQELNKCFIGYIVIQPVYSGLIGTTVINPNYLKNCSGYMCLARFKCNVYGHRLSVLGFLFSSQNSETVTCAELTILGIVNTLANLSTSYRTILPSEIAYDKSITDYERALPSKGLPYETISRLLCKYTGSSRLYFLDIDDKIDDIDDEKRKKIEERNEKKRDNFKKLFHTYVESGYPLAVAVKAKTDDNPNIRHSVICIGHGNISCDWSVENNRRKIGDFKVIDSYKGYNKYVLIDDNRTPYVIGEFKNFTKYASSEVVGFAVSLPRSAFLEADEAYQIGIEALFNFDDTKMDEISIKELVNYDKDNNPLVIRLFLVTSWEYKKFKSSTIQSDTLRDYYLKLNLPHYIYVMEVTTAVLYNDKLAFGDVIIDATASGIHHGLDSVINIHYCDRMGSFDSINGEDYINKDVDGFRNRWGSFNAYNDIEEIFAMYNSDNNRSVSNEKAINNQQ